MQMYSKAADWKLENKCLENTVHIDWLPLVTHLVSSLGEGCSLCYFPVNLTEPILNLPGAGFERLHGNNFDLLVDASCLEEGGFLQMAFSFDFWSSWIHYFQFVLMIIHPFSRALNGFQKA